MARDQTPFLSKPECSVSFIHQAMTLGEGQCSKTNTGVQPLLRAHSSAVWDMHQEEGCWIVQVFYFSVFEETFFRRMAGPAYSPSTVQGSSFLANALDFLSLLVLHHTLMCAPVSEPARCYG